MTDTNTLPFDPAIIRVKITELRRQAHGLVTLLESYGLKVEPDAIQAPTAPPRRRSPSSSSKQRRRRRVAGAHLASIKTEPKLADVAFTVLNGELHGRSHGKQLIEGLQRKGRLLNASHPDSSLSTALSRDSRFERVPGAPNTWAIRKDVKAAG